MLAVLAALHLQVVRRARIGGIWYGAFDPDTDEAPVHNLVGLLRIASWLQALHTYDKDGDYGVFAPLLGDAGTPSRRGRHSPPGPTGRTSSRLATRPPSCSATSCNGA
jgi:hypothetical protein